MFILHFNDTFAAGGSERFIVEQSIWLAEHNVQIYVLALNSPATLLEQNDDKLNWSVIGISPRSHPLRCARALRQYILAHNPSIVHVHSFFGLLIERLAFPDGRTHRLIATLHNLGYLAWPARTLYQRFRKRVHGWLLRGCDQITAVSEAVAKHYQSQFSLPKIIIIANPLPKAAEARMTHQFGTDKSWPPRKFVLPGRITREKGHDVALEALAMLRDRRIEVSLEILGDGPLRPEVKTGVERFGLGNVVHFSSPQTHELFLDAIQQADACLIPSVSEGFGIVALEAMAMGTPVIASRVGGLPEIIEHEKSGWLVPPGDSAALADCIQRIIEQPVSFDAIVQNARIIAQRYAPDRLGEQWMELYSQFLEPGD